MKSVSYQPLKIISHIFNDTTSLKRNQISLTINRKKLVNLLIFGNIKDILSCHLDD